MFMLADDITSFLWSEKTLPTNIFFVWNSRLLKIQRINIHCGINPKQDICTIFLKAQKTIKKKMKETRKDQKIKGYKTLFCRQATNTVITKSYQ